MVAHTRRALDLAIQFRKAIALDLVTVSAQDSYDLLKLTVQNSLRRVRLAENVSAQVMAKGIEPSDKMICEMNYVPTRQDLDAAKALIHMSGLSEPVRENEGKDVQRMSLAELEAMIKDLRVVEGSAAPGDVTSDQPIDIFS